MNRQTRRALTYSILSIVAAVFATQVRASEVTDYVSQPAHSWQSPADSMILAASVAGSRIVAVGEHGIIMLSDDNGKSFRQARAVPTRATLNDVTFVDAQEGWAVGHAGVVLHTTDAGETWTEQRKDTRTDQPLFSVAFSDSKHGVAVGLWSLALRTEDGGVHWTNFSLPAGPGKSKDQLNLYSVSSEKSGSMLITAEQGAVFISDDRGATWHRQETGYTGSLWTGTATSSGVLYVAGLRGSLYESSDHGKSWRRCETGTSSSITRLTSVGDTVIGVGLDGTEIQAAGSECSFKATRSPTRAAFTGLVVASNGEAVLFSKEGVVQSSLKVSR